MSDNSLNRYLPRWAQVTLALIAALGAFAAGCTWHASCSSSFDVRQEEPGKIQTETSVERK